jgi:hypothetical protein
MVYTWQDLQLALTQPVAATSFSGTTLKFFAVVSWLGGHVHSAAHTHWCIVVQYV